jgi:hypothetical protein
MRPRSSWQSIARRMQRAGIAIRRFFGPLRPDDESRPKVPRAPFFVSYGRAAFCLHFPDPRPPSGSPTGPR